ncbi:MAG: DUF3341 domain-containing protein [Bryobacterales bacterium]
MNDIFCIAAEFETPEALIAASEKTRDAGFKKFECYTPFPVHGLADAMGLKRPILSWIIFAGGLVGLCAGFGLAYWVSVINGPYNIGGRPLNSWPSFIPVTFETTVLVASLTAVIGMIAFNGLPRPYHPVFNYPRFNKIMDDRFLLTIESTDPKFDREQTSEFLRGLNPTEVVEVENE